MIVNAIVVIAIVVVVVIVVVIVFGGVSANYCVGVVTVVYVLLYSVLNVKVSIHV